MDKRGAMTFGDRWTALQYFYCLPDGYSGRLRVIESGRWMVTYKRETCPHCGCLLTGMNSNPDDCLQNPTNQKARGAQ